MTGISLPPPTSPALFDQLSLGRQIRHRIVDIRDLEAVKHAVAETQPDFLFHLAAQPLVLASYAQPVETYATNVMGTVHVLEALRLANFPCVAILATTDKCYENREWVHSYRENDPMGGYDPYSSSKGAAELAIAAYRRSYFSSPDSAIRVASVRAGNVIGGGDWAQRIVPDCIRGLMNDTVFTVRNKGATRPWQHVLEALSGYLWLGARLSQRGPLHFDARLASAFNFGPSLDCNRTVLELVCEILKHWPGHWEDKTPPEAPHEAMLLNLATDKAYHLLGWKPVWDFETAVAECVRWYRLSLEGNGERLIRTQISAYEAAARTKGLPWCT